MSEVGARVKKAIKYAKAAALKCNDGFQYRHGAALLRGNKVLSTGVNQPRPVSWVHYNKRQDPFFLTMHAEISCIHGIDGNKIRGSTVVVVRVSKNQVLTNSKPCGTCIHEMRRKQVSKCYYSVADNQIGVLDLR